MYLYVQYLVKSFTEIIQYTLKVKKNVCITHLQCYIDFLVFVLQNIVNNAIL